MIFQLSWKNYFVLKVNIIYIIYESAKVHNRNQLPKESVEVYIRALCEVAKNCDFDNRGDMIQDRTVVGILDKERSRKMQL